MKILIVNNFLSPNIVGGAEISVGNLVKSLRARGLEVYTLSLGTDTKDKNKYNLKLNYPLLHKIWTVNKNRGVLQRIAFQFLPDILSQYIKRKLVKLIKEHNFDLIHTNNLAGIGVGIWQAAQSQGIPVVHTLRDYYQICAKQTMYDKKNCDPQ